MNVFELDKNVQLQIDNCYHLTVASGAFEVRY